MRAYAVRLMDKGVVVDLGNDLEGFAPISQLGVPEIQSPADAVQEGQPLDVKILEVDPIHHRIVVAVVAFPDEPFKVPPPRVPYEEEGDEGNSVTAEETPVEEAAAAPAAEAEVASEVEVPAAEEEAPAPPAAEAEVVASETPASAVEAPAAETESSPEAEAETPEAPEAMPAEGGDEAEAKPE
jgi:small subunit ribosomal protein S1